MCSSCMENQFYPNQSMKLLHQQQQHLIKHILFLKLNMFNNINNYWVFFVIKTLHFKLASICPCVKKLHCLFVDVSISPDVVSSITWVGAELTSSLTGVELRDQMFLWGYLSVCQRICEGGWALLRQKIPLSAMVDELLWENIVNNLGCVKQFGLCWG